MIDVLDPDTLEATFYEGPLKWSLEDASAYLIADAGAIPLSGTRELEALDNEQSVGMGADWFSPAGELINAVAPANPVPVGESRFEGLQYGVWVTGKKKARLDTGTALSPWASTRPASHPSARTAKPPAR